MTSMNRPHYLSPVKQTARLLFAYKNFAAVHGISHIGLGVSQMHTANTLHRQGVWTKVAPINSVADLRKELLAKQATAVLQDDVRVSHVILAAPWLTTAELNSLLYDFHDVCFVVVCHSNCAFLAADTGAIRRLKEMIGLQVSTPNFHLAGNSQRFCHWAQNAYGHTVITLPNLYDVSTFKKLSPHRKYSNPLQVGCFGSMRPLKNMFTAAAASMEVSERLGMDVEFHVTGGRDDYQSTIKPIAELFSDNHRVKLVQHNWMTWTDFRRLVSRMHVMMQPSFTESFNLVTADGVAEGVPSAVSTAIDWAPPRWQVEADDANALAGASIRLLNDLDAPHDGQDSLRKYVVSGTKDWMDYICPMHVAMGT